MKVLELMLKYFSWGWERYERNIYFHYVHWKVNVLLVFLARTKENVIRGEEIALAELNIVIVKVEYSLYK